MATTVQFTPHGAAPQAPGTRFNPVRYRLDFGWDVRLAHRAVGLADGRKQCTCYRGAECPTPGKHPLGKWKYGEGLTLPDPRSVAGQWQTHGWNVAVLTGKRSGVVVADVDPRHGGTLDALWALGWPQHTPVEQTGGGGWHVYAACPPDGLPSVDGYAPGVELKADGKLVIAAPSVYWDGTLYRWLVSPWKVVPAALPAAVLAAMRPRRTEHLDDYAALRHVTPGEYVYPRDETKRIADRMYYYFR
jgi:Bifunctional DNA primase/polymerase, N-terminal